MTDIQHQCRSLASWALDGSAFRQKLDRRAVFGSALAGGAAALFLGSKAASALTVQNTPPIVLGAIPERRGVLPWRTLALTDAQYGQKPKIPAAVQKLDGREVLIEGHMLPLDDSEHVRRFLLSAYNAHCPFCMPGGMVSIVAIRAEAAISLTDKPLTMHGTLRLISERGSSLIYRLDKATLAT
jgi:hypothetical protein